MDTTTVPVTEQAVVTPKGKVCTRCNQWKPFDKYGFHPSTQDHKLKICRSCASKAHKEPFEKIDALLANGQYVPTGYGGKNYQKYAERKLAEQGKAQPHGEIRIRVGHGVIEQPRRHVTVTPTTYQEENNVIETPAAPPVTYQAAPNVPSSPLTALPTTTLEAFMTEPDGTERPSMFLVGDVVIARAGDTFWLLSADDSTPRKAIASDLLGYIVRLKTGAASEGEVTGVRFA